MQPVQYIDDAKALVDLCRQLETAPWFALDTEFVRERTYFPRLCLIQIATPDLVACVDPLSLAMFDPLLDLIYDPKHLKVLHACSQDLEIFYWLRKAVPGPLFDTQIAASALGYGDQLSYAAVVDRELEVKLDKAQTRTDWSMRPLSAAQLRYAADDVIYLAEIYPRLREKLAQRGRLAWVEEECALTGDSESYAPEAKLPWRKLPGVGDLSAQKLSVLRALALWRERRAMQDNRPRQWILPDLTLTDLAQRLPAVESTMIECSDMNDSRYRRYGAELLRVIAAALAEPEHCWPEVRARMSPEQMTTVQDLMRRMREIATAHELAPAMLATRAEMEAWVRGENAARVMHGWRAELLGAELQTLLGARGV